MSEITNHLLGWFYSKFEIAMNFEISQQRETNLKNENLEKKINPQ